MAETFKSAMRGYAPVRVPLLVADVLVAALLLWDSPAPPRVWLAAFAIAVVLLWSITYGICAVFAAKDVWWYRQRVKQEAAKLAAHEAIRGRHQHATDLLTCPGPCKNPTGCLWGVCVIAAVKRDPEAP